ncbi:MAG: hypothetical protein ISR57_05275 [Bacteroidales bacterium]|nr:hypothetical protein [Bacteroidota bacterium]MBL6950041.1 hypothetical protein [Bacteroidales bacterium]
MKTIKYLAAIIILVVGTQIGLAANDGNSTGSSPIRITLKLMSLFPVIPAMADFDDQPTDKELFSPTVPLYAPYSEAL